jgi:hypothetical protein
MASTVPLTRTKLEMHSNLLVDLLATREKLMGVDPAALDVDRRVDWNEQVYEVSLAIVAVQRPILPEISVAYARRLPKIRRAIAKLNKDSKRLSTTNDVIAMVGTELGTITSIVRLLS